MEALADPRRQIPAPQPDSRVDHGDAGDDDRRGGDHRGVPRRDPAVHDPAEQQWLRHREQGIDGHGDQEKNDEQFERARVAENPSQDARLEFLLQHRPVAREGTDAVTRRSRRRMGHRAT